MARRFADAPSKPHDPDREELDELMTARGLLVKIATQLGNHAEGAPRSSPTALAAVAASLAASGPGWRRPSPPSWRRPSASPSGGDHRKHPGIGQPAAAGNHRWLPELGRIGHKPAAALVGAAPYDDDSGKRHGERHIKGGRREIRELLYMSPWAASPATTRFSRPTTGSCSARGKPFKVALIACLRKLVVILGAMLRAR